MQKAVLTGVDEPLVVGVQDLARLGVDLLEDGGSSSLAFRSKYNANAFVITEVTGSATEIYLAIYVN